MVGPRTLPIGDGQSLPPDVDDKLHRLLGYWRTKCADGALPHRRDIDPTEIAPLLSAIFMLDVAEGDFRFRLVGQDVVARYGSLKGRALRELMSGAELERTLAEHRLWRLPVFSENSLQSAGSGDWLLYQRLLVPLADDAGKVAALAGIMTFRLRDGA